VTAFSQSFSHLGCYAVMPLTQPWHSSHAKYYICNREDWIGAPMTRLTA
jgi:hypothetical protein